MATNAAATPGAIAVRLALLFRDAGKRGHDAPDCPEQTDERPARHRRGQNDHAFFQPHRLAARRLFQNHLHRFKGSRG